MYSMFNDNGIYNNGSYVCLDIYNMDKAIKYVKEHRVEEIFISNFTEEKYKVDLSFLKELPFVKKLMINSNLLDLSEIEVLYDLRKLEDLVWFCEEELDIENFKSLKNLAVTYPENLNLKSSTVTKLEVSYLDSIEQLLGIEYLETLTLRYYKGEDINHLDELRFLSSFTIKLARKLINIEAINKCQKLRTLEFESIRKDLELGPLSRCDSLEELYIFNKIKSCDFIKDMKNIHSFLSKEILSGDLSPMFENKSLKHVKLLGYKKYYNYTKKEFASRFDSW